MHFTHPFSMLLGLANKRQTRRYITKIMQELKKSCGVVGILLIVGVWYYTYVCGSDHDEHDISYLRRNIPQRTSLDNFVGSHLFGVIEDGDSQPHARPDSKSWASTYAIGKLHVYMNMTASFEMLNTTTLVYNLAEGGRGMELSELVKFQNELLSVDDRTGVVYSIESNSVVPRYILVDGNGHSKKGFKGEWMTVKDHFLYVGGFGKPWTTPSGQILNYDPMWVKRISPEGVIEHMYWKRNYEALMRAADVEYPGYIYYEAVCWSPHHERWFFLPRRLSKDQYDDKKDEVMGSNVMFVVDELFKSIQVKTVGPLHPTHGFSSFKFLPYSKDEIIVALKSEEVDGGVKTYITMFTIHGTILMPEQLIGNKKFEGIAFL